LYDVFFKILVFIFVNEILILELDRQIFLKSFTGAFVFTESQVAAYDVFEQSARPVVEVFDHGVEHHADRLEALGSLADVLQPIVVHQNLLHDEGCHRFGEVTPPLHDAQTERNDFGLQQEGDHFVVVSLDQRPDDAQRSQPQLLLRLGLVLGVEEGLEIQRNVRSQEFVAGVFILGNALQDGEHVADPVGLLQFEDVGPVVQQRLD